MKKIFSIVALLFCSVALTAQLNVSLLVSATPPATLSQWNDRRETLTYLVSYRPGSIRQVKIKTEFKLTDGTVVGTTDLARARTISLLDGNNFFFAADVLPLDVMIFSGKYKNTLEKTGKLPSDNYQLCVQLVNPVDFTTVSEQRCRIFNLAALQLSIPVMPANEMMLDARQAQTAITFRWTPVTPRPVFTVTYRIMVFEVPTDQQPVQAMRSNQPLVVRDIIGTTQFIWQPQLGMIDCCPQGDADGDKKVQDKSSLNESKAGKRFVWTVQCFDAAGQPISDGNVNGDGISEPAVFIIGKGGKEVDKLKEEIKKINK